MNLKRTEQIWLKPNKQLGSLCHIAKNLYNEANYIVRQEFINNGKCVSYYELDTMLRDSENAKLLPAQTRQQLLKQLDRNWKSFFKAIKVWSKDKTKFNDKPNLPKYKKKDGEHSLIFTNQNCKIENGMIHFPKKINLDLEVQTRIKNEDMQQIRIIPKGFGYVLEIVYNKEVNPTALNKERVVSIDIGMKNLVTVSNNIGKKPFVVKASVPKSDNQYYNKEYAKIMHNFDKYGQKTSKKLNRLLCKRNRKINDFFHKTTRCIMDWCVDNDIGIIVIGYNKNWKQQINIGKKNNQHFVQLPFYKLINQLQYKAEELGIDTTKQDEAHTSKCSFLDNESIEHHNNYVGKRTSRGIFKSKKNILINADVNGALNIGRKAIPNAFSKEMADEIEDVGLHPFKYNVLKKETLNYF